MDTMVEPRPPRADALFLGAAEAHRAGRLEEARRLYDAALEADAGHAPALGNLALLHFAGGDAAGALQLLVRAARLAPHDPDHPGRLGTMLTALGREEEALPLIEAAIRLAPGVAAWRNELGNALLGLGREDEARRAYEEAVAADPRCAKALANLGARMTAAGDPDGAARVLRRAIRLDGADPVARFNLGVALMRLERDEEAVAAFGEACRLGPLLAEPRTNLGMALLRLGRLEEGWQAFDSRWAQSDFAASRRRLPRWDGSGEPPDLLLHAEQGLGDTLMFCRFAPIVAARGHHVVLEAQEPLVGLLGTSLEGPHGAGRVTVVARGPAYPALDGLPPVAAQCPLMSVAGKLGVARLRDIPGAPYLKADDAAARRWRERLAAASSGARLRVGLVWAGNSYAGLSPALVRIDARRSLNPAELVPLSRVPGVVLVSLQKGRPERGGLELIDWTEELADFADTAALVEALDLVITVDTAVAHVAGALGKETWLLNRADGCWRWLSGRSDSPWYPSMRLFRQKRPMRWRPVVAMVAEALARRAAA
jgi:Flp pilus assembly protein TadD